MNWFQRLFNKTEQKQFTGVFPFGSGAPNMMDTHPDTISTEAYRKLVVAYRCVNLIADSVAGIKINLFKNDKEVEKHPVLDLLNKPNPMQDYTQLTKCAMAYFALHGNSFIQGMSATPQTPPVRLICHRTSSFRVEPGKNFIPSAYVFRKGTSQEQRFQVDIMGRSEILHMKTFNPLNDWLGQSPISPAATDVDTMNSANVWNLSLLQNSARPSGVFFYTGDGTLNSEKRRTLKKDIDKMWVGPFSSGKPMLLGGKIDFKELSLSPKDMDFINSKKVSKVDIALAFGVPGQVVGVEGSQTFANFAQAILTFYEDTVLPIAEMWIGSLNRWLVASYPNSEGMELRIDEDSIHALEPRRKMQWDKAQNADWLTPNEKRALTGYEPYQPTDDPADQLYVSTSIMPLGEEFDTTIAEVDGDESDDDGDVDPIDEDGDEDEKSFNLNSRRGKLQFWRAQNRKRDRMISGLRAKMNVFFREERKGLIEAIDGVENQDIIENVIKEYIITNSVNLRPILRSSIESAMKAFGTSVIRSMGKKAASDKLDFAIRSYIEREVGEKITNLSRSTRKKVLRRVKDAIAKAEAEGQTTIQAAKAIEGIYGEFTKKRSLTIARTEIHNAASEGSLAGAKASGVPSLKKEWVSNLDSRVRDSHAEMNGRKVGIDEKFLVPSKDGPDIMSGPGDPSAPADQVINCRCVLVYSQ